MCSYDLVLAGTRGLAAWEQSVVGSTAKRLLRECSATVWIAKAEHAGPAKVVLAATGLSAVRFPAVTQGLTAKLSDATGTAILRLLAEGLSLKQLLTEGLLQMVKLSGCWWAELSGAGRRREGCCPPARRPRKGAGGGSDVRPLGACIAIIYVLWQISLFVYVMVRGYE